MLAEGFSNFLANPFGRVRTSSPELGGADPEEPRVFDTRFVDGAGLVVVLLAVLRAVLRRVEPPAAAFVRLVLFRAAFFADFFFAALFLVAAFFFAAFLRLGFLAVFLAALFGPFRAAFLVLLPARFPTLLRAAGFRAVFLRADMMRSTSPSLGRMKRAFGA